MNKIEKCRETQKNRIVIHKGNEEKRIYKNELDIYLKQGWCLGISEDHRRSLSEKHLNKEPWNKGTKGIMKPNKTTWQKGNQPWNKGKKGLQEGWNKGLTKDTDSRVAQISRSKLGHMVSQEARDKMSKARKGKKLPNDKLQIKLSKEYLTKKKNNSFNKSDKEEQFYKDLCELNKSKTIYRQYKDSRYPYYCDFYIKEDDLFIECNFHWTHGGKPYDSNNIECQRQLLEWQEKAKTSQYFKNAIETWTVRDVNKQKIARENKLNYKVIY